MTYTIKSTKQLFSLSLIVLLASCNRGNPDVQLHILNGQDETKISFGDQSKTLKKGKTKVLSYYLEENEDAAWLRLENNNYFLDSLLTEGIYILNLSEKKNISVQRISYATKELNDFFREKGLGPSLAEAYGFGIYKVGYLSRKGYDWKDLTFTLVDGTYSFKTKPPSSLRGRKSKSFLDIDIAED